MKIIISHDVDHLYPKDHFFKDLIFPKLWIRSFGEFLKQEISFQTFLWRLVSVFDRRLNRIPELILYDKQKGIKSTFFFGMDQLLGMSYRRSDARKWIKYVMENGMEAGVHGVEIDDEEKMKEEYRAFQSLSGLDKFGIRTHYVRYNDTTFHKMSSIGYLFDTSEFNKQNIELKAPYRIGEMWEFPLYLMDGYVMKNDIEKAQKVTMEALKEAKEHDIQYFTFLFHDYMFNDRTYKKDKAYYEWFVQYCVENDFEFVSYRDAIRNKFKIILDTILCRE